MVTQLCNLTGTLFHSLTVMQLHNFVLTQSVTLALWYLGYTVTQLVGYPETAKQF